MKKRIIISCVFALILTCLAVNMTFSQSPSIVIKGRVTDSQTDKPIADASVKYKQPGQGDYSRGVITDSEGNYSISVSSLLFNAKGVIFTMEASADGYYLKEIEIILKEGSNSIDIRLDKIKIPITREFKINHRDPNEIFQLLQPYINNQYGKASISEKLKTIVVTDLPEQLETIQQKISSYDVPLKRIWVEVKLIKATGNSQEKPTYSQEIEGIAKQLNTLFKFSHYELVGRADAMGLEGSALQFSASPDPSPMSLFTVSTIVEYFDNVIKLDKLQIQTYPKPSNLTTTVNVGNGETVILGASQGGDPQQGSLITVVTAKVVE